MEPTPVSEVIAGQKRILNRKRCLHPDAGRGSCSAEMARSHSIQRTALAAIARNGHVYGYASDLGRLKRNSGAILPRLIGINDASGFFGFCAKHNAATFRPIESQPIRTCPEHMFLLGYRARAYEVYMRDAQLAGSEQARELDRGKSRPYQIAVQSNVGAHMRSAALGKKDQTRIWERYQRALRRRDFSAVHYYAVRTAETPNVLCCVCLVPGCLVPDAHKCGRSKKMWQ
jgi:hypothetical protein